MIVEVEYSARTGGTKYQMALIDTVFDNGSVYKMVCFSNGADWIL